MSCQQTIEGAQTEFEFFQQMVSNPGIQECCGPITEIGFTRHSMIATQEAVLSIGLPSDYLDRYDPKALDSEHMSLRMCPKHWIYHATGISAIAEQQDNGYWGQVAFFMFRYVCLTNDWDYKEILNYAKSAGSVKPE